jgi:hypothetical protein
MRRTQGAPAGVPVSRAPIAAAPPTPAPVRAPEAAPRPIARKAEPAVSRFSARDYSYVRRELQRIIVLATLIVVLIVVLSFFLP